MLMQALATPLHTIFESLLDGEPRAKAMANFSMPWCKRQAGHRPNWRWPSMRRRLDWSIPHHYDKRWALKLLRYWQTLQFGTERCQQLRFGHRYMFPTLCCNGLSYIYCLIPNTCWWCKRCARFRAIPCKQWPLGASCCTLCIPSQAKRILEELRLQLEVGAQLSRYHPAQAERLMGTIIEADIWVPCRMGIVGLEVCNPVHAFIASNLWGRTAQGTENRQNQARDGLALQRERLERKFGSVDWDLTTLNKEFGHAKWKFRPLSRDSIPPCGSLDPWSGSWHC